MTLSNSLFRKSGLPVALQRDAAAAATFFLTLQSQVTNALAFFLGDLNVSYLLCEIHTKAQGACCKQRRMFMARPSDAAKDATP